MGGGSVTELTYRSRTEDDAGKSQGKASWYVNSSHPGYRLPRYVQLGMHR